MIILKKIVLAFGCIFVFLLLGFFIYLKANPPLTANGISFYEDEDTKRVVEIVNSGFTDIKLKNILVNGEAVKDVELGTSRTDHLVLGAGLDDDPYITFHDFKTLAVQPKLSLNEQKELYDDKQIIKHYGLRFYGKEVPKKLTIEYTYLFIPFSLEVNVSENK